MDMSGCLVPNNTNPSGLAFYPMTPCRLVDTRNPAGLLGGPALVGGAAGRSFPLLTSSCNVSGTAQAYSLNVTAGPTNAGIGFLTAWATGPTQPLASTLKAPSS